jgi:hypothetical protein
MSVHDAELGDLYVDGTGKLWRVIALCGEPAVHFQEVEMQTPDSPVRRSGGVSGLMWNGYKRIHRPLKPAPEPAPEPKTISRSRDWHYDSQSYCDNPGRGY